MSTILIKKFPTRAAFSVRPLPFMARFHRYACHYDCQRQNIDLVLLPLGRTHNINAK